ncbi:MAG: NADH:flavin oxidoreductase, partial [Verrucomicrobiota bacterium]
MPSLKLASVRHPAELRQHLASLGADLAVDDALASGPAAPLAAPLALGERRIGNRFAILPMEGW